MITLKLYIYIVSI